MDRPHDLASARARLAALLPELRERYAVEALFIFGSFARGEQTPESDLDVLVDFRDVPGLFEFVNMGHFLEDRLGLPVDLFTRPMLKDRIVPRVAQDQVGV